jgi:hypothetical protein
VSQIVLAYILTESQLKEYAKAVSEGNDGFPNDELEFLPAFGFNAPPMIALHMMLEDAFDNADVGSMSDHEDTLREHGVPLLLALHVEDRGGILPIFEKMASDPIHLGQFYEEFFSETWDEAPAAMLEACRFVQSGLERLDETNCWFLLFVS